MDRPTYSIVIPVYNEEKTLAALRARLLDLLDDLDGDAEVVLVDDGSKDRSRQVLAAMHLTDPRFKVVHLSRNFGHQVAITAGMDLAEGEAVVVMDADLQDPPEVVLEMAKRWREGYEVVYGVREDRTSDSWFKRRTAAAFYSVLGRLSEVEIPAEVGDFRLVDRRAVDAFKSMREGSRFVRGMFSWMGFRQIGVPYKRDARVAGETKYPFRKMLRLASDGVVGFSRLPLRMALNVGFFFSGVSVLFALLAAVLKLSGIYTVSGWTSVVIAITFLGGMQLAVMGVMGEYVGRTYEEVIRRPLYVVSALHGVRPGVDGPGRSVIAAPRTIETLFGPEPAIAEIEGRSA